MNNDTIKNYILKKYEITSDEFNAIEEFVYGSALFDVVELISYVNESKIKNQMKIIRTEFYTILIENSNVGILNSFNDIYACAENLDELDDEEISLIREELDINMEAKKLIKIISETTSLIMKNKSKSDKDIAKNHNIISLYKFIANNIDYYII